MTVRPVGSAHPVDASGRLLRDAGLDRIAPHWQALCDDAVAVYREAFGDVLYGVYLRGSVARGTAMDGIADLDSFAVADRPPSAGKSRSVVFAKGPAEAERLQRAHPFAESVEIWVVSLQAVREAPDAAHLRFALATQTVCLWGEDLGAELPRPRPGPDTVFLLPMVDHLIEDAEVGVQNGEPIPKVCRWIAKLLVRAGMEAVIGQSDTYARDLWPCYQLFATHRPDAAGAMYRMLELAIDPIDDFAAVTTAVAAVRPHLAPSR